MFQLLLVKINPETRCPWWRKVTQVVMWCHSAVMNQRNRKVMNLLGSSLCSICPKKTLTHTERVKVREKRLSGLTGGPNIYLIKEKMNDLAWKYTNIILSRFSCYRMYVCFVLARSVWVFSLAPVAHTVPVLEGDTLRAFHYHSALIINMPPIWQWVNWITFLM